MKKLILFIALFTLTACGPREADFKSDVPARPAFEERVMTEDGEMPEAVNYAVPFYPQAPDGDWGLPWQDACEEASLALAYHYYQGTDLSKAQFKSEILGMVEWQNKNFGSYKDTNVEQTAQILKEYYGVTDYKILENPSIAQLKEELADGNLIVAPFAGRMLRNPFYSGEGPYYHMLVIRGYDEKNFITNDVGTKRGENFIYPYNTLMEAMHDFHESDIELMSGRVIVLGLH